MGKPTGHRLAAALLGIGLCLAAVPAGAHDWVYTARPGDNLWDLSREYLVQGVRYTERLRAHNAIADPLRIPPGSRIRFPIRWLKQQPASARLVRRVGEVRILRAGGGVEEAALGTELRIGDRVETGSDSSATVQLADGSRMLVQAATAVTFDAMTAYHTTGMVDTRMRLHGGRIENRVERAKGPAARYRIITPAAVAAVRGTDFRVGFRAEADTMVSEVTDGTVGVAAQAVTRRVEAGFGLIAQAGAPPSPPRPLLPAPALAGLPAVAERLLLAFEWPAVAGAAGYRAQIYPRDDPDRLLLDKPVARSAVEWDAPPDGDYLLRVRAVDGDGIEGLGADHPFRLDARPVPPSPLRPAEGARIHGPEQELWWSRPEDAASFRLQVARDAAFSDLVVHAEGLREPRMTLDPPLAPADYLWRLAVTNGAGEPGPFGDPRRLTVLAVPAAPGAGESAVDESQVRVTWGRAADAAAYEFQLARDAEFTDLVVDERVAATEYTLDTPEADTYYFRARGVSDEGVTGAYSPVNSFEIEAEPWPPSLLLLLAPLLLLL